MRPKRLLEALRRLSEAMVEMNAALEELRSEHDPLASHIFISRRDYRRAIETDTKSGKRSEREARLSWQKACNLGFRGQLGNWRQLLGAMARR